MLLFSLKASLLCYMDHSGKKTKPKLIKFLSSNSKLSIGKIKVLLKNRLESIRLLEACFTLPASSSVNLTIGLCFSVHYRILVEFYHKPPSTPGMSHRTISAISKNSAVFYWKSANLIGSPTHDYLLIENNPALTRAFEKQKNLPSDFLTYCLHG